jgi:hypothetical protein
MEGKRLAMGFVWGIVATIAMSIPMMIAMMAGVSPAPNPIPLAVLERVFGSGFPRPLLMVLAMASHLGYGGFWGAVLAAMARPVSVRKGLGLGVVLWLIMQVIVLPLIGWGPFGTAITPRIAVATLVLHLIYGATYGALMDSGWVLARMRKQTPATGQHI